MVVSKYFLCIWGGYLKRYVIVNIQMVRHDRILYKAVDYTRQGLRPV